MCRFLISAMAVALLLGAASAEASCIYPNPPASIPDGTVATYDQMVAAHAAVREFDEDVRTFNVCFELEVKTLLEDPSVDDETKDDLRRLLVARIDAAVDEAEFVVEQFNEQLRIFRARNE
jgi:predicted outer membrane protein